MPALPTAAVIDMLLEAACPAAPAEAFGAVVWVCGAAPALAEAGAVAAAPGLVVLTASAACGVAELLQALQRAINRTGSAGTRMK
jgi:hypothetical protein